MLGLLFIVFNVIALNLNKVKANPDEMNESIDAEEKARNVWCQLIGDRQGCRDDNSRTCDNTVFCE